MPALRSPRPAPVQGKKGRNIEVRERCGEAERRGWGEEAEERAGLEELGREGPGEAEKRRRGREAGVTGARAWADAKGGKTRGVEGGRYGASS